MSIIITHIVGFEGHYCVSSEGFIYSLDRKAGNRMIKGRQLKPKNNGGGYLFVALSKENKITRAYIHRLVASAFLENNEMKQSVNHRDGDPTNNKLENLEWATHAENVKHAYDFGLYANKGASLRLSSYRIPVVAGFDFPKLVTLSEFEPLKRSA